MRRVCGIVRSWCLAAMVVLAVGSGIFAQSAAKAGDTKMLTPEASLNLRNVGDLEFSADGARLAFVVTEPAKGTGRLTHIWVYERASGAMRQFTFSAKSETAPRWSPDGKQLAFLSNRAEDQQQIFLMRTEGGDGRAATKGKRSVKAFEWSADGKQIAFLAPDAKTEEEEKKEKDKDDAKVVDKDDKHARLWILDVASGEARALTKPNWNFDELAWLPAGDRVVVKGTDRPESDQYTERIFSVQVADGAMKELVKPLGPFGEMRVAPDGKTISYVGPREDGPEPHDLMLLPVTAHAARNLTGASLDRLVQDYHWQKDGSVVLLAANGFSNLLVTYSVDGTRHDLSPATGPAGSMALTSGGEIAFVSQGATRPQEVWLWDQKSAPWQVTHLNDSWKQYSLIEPEFYKYKSFDGAEIEAALLKPRVSPSANPEIHPAKTAGWGGGGVPGRGAEGKSKLPLIVLIHGGPTGRWGDSIETWGQLLATHGYAVFYPNIRGSVGYGEKFVESNRGDWGGGDFKDVMAGVDDLVKRGIADPEKLGIGGWSYGGYMAEWAITQTNVFKAAVSGAGMANLISEFGTEDHPAGDEWFFGVPWEKPEGFLNSSPFVHLKNAKTPTLVLQGDADTVDPLGQSQELYRGLKRYGVETELVVYPREPHGFHEEKHLVDRLNRILAWYDKYLKKEAQKDLSGKS
jgi:dipeptidyl aminopeptidase/acylaminoacyl peptidase